MTDVRECPICRGKVAFLDLGAPDENGKLKCPICKGKDYVTSFMKVTPITKSDEHYRSIEGSSATEPIVIMEELADRLIAAGVPAAAVTNIILGQKHVTRASVKSGEDWRKEIQKSINYFTRAVTGDWIK